MVEGRVKFPSKVSGKGNMSLVWQRPFEVIPGAVSFFLSFFFFFFFFFQLLFLETLPLTSSK